MSKVILAIGGHIGDACLTSGGVMASNAIDGGKNYVLALTAGERGNPKGVTIENYRKQKIRELQSSMDLLNGEGFVLDYCDGELPNNDEVRKQVAEYIVKLKPDIIITHWHSKMHKDHNATHYIVQDAQFIAAVIGVNGQKHYAKLYFAENWEDDGDFKPYFYVDITRGYDLWCEVLRNHYFIMNSKDFDYYDYYTSMARARGALAKTKYAECFDQFDFDKKIIKTEL